MSVIVRYSDVAIGAKKAFNAEVNGIPLAFSNEKIKAEGVAYKRYDTPFELNSMLLDGGANFLPDEGEPFVGYISEQMSDENGNFPYDPSGYNRPKVVFKAEENYTSSGITIRCDEEKNIFATEVIVRWRRTGLLLDEQTFFPDSPNYFCSHKVEFFDEVEIVVLSLNVPFSRFRLNSVDFGLVVDFTGRELRSARITQEIDPISTYIPITPFDFQIDSQKGIEFSFQERQPLTVIFNDKVLCKTFVKTADRKSKTMWSIKSEDFIGVMDTVYFPGSLYVEKPVGELISEIFQTAKVPFVVDADVASQTVNGHIPYTTCREAMLQVLFAVQAVADTTGGENIHIRYLTDDVSQTVPLERIMQGQSFAADTRVTAVEVVAHGYSPSTQIYTAYNAAESGTGDNIFVVFQEPVHTLSITNGEFVDRNINYAIINAREGCVLTAQGFSHSTAIHRKKNPVVLPSDTENIVTIANATLVSSKNVDFVLNKCYNYIVETNRTVMQIVDGRGEKPDGTVYFDQPTSVGDVIEYETEFSGVKIGRIVRQSYSLGGGILVKNSTVR